MTVNHATLPPISVIDINWCKFRYDEKTEELIAGFEKILHEYSELLANQLKRDDSIDDKLKAHLFISDPYRDLLRKRLFEVMALRIPVFICELEVIGD